MTTRPLRVGLIGAGNIAAAHLPAYAEFGDVVQIGAVCDVVESSAARRAAELQLDAAHVYTDAAKMLREAAIDAVLICTTHDQHAPLALAAIAAGKHVLVEKPMACSMADCRAMIDAADRAGVVMMIGQMQRYDAGYAGVKTLIDRGALGPVRAARIDSMQNFPAFAGPEHWLFDGQRAGGGTVISVLVHKIDLMRHFLGDAVRVSATCRAHHPYFVNDAEDYAAAVIEFASGAICDAFATYSAPRMPWSEQFMLFGAGGAVHAVPPIGQYNGPAQVSLALTPTLSDWNAQFRGWEPVAAVHDHLPSDDAFTNQTLHFAHCCRTGEIPLTSGRDNLGTMRIVFGIYESSRTGRPVDLETL